MEGGAPRKVKPPVESTELWALAFEIRQNHVLDTGSELPFEECLRRARERVKGSPGARR